MTVMLHPNKVNPERYRVLEKGLGINEYFSFAKYGRTKAKKLAEERQAELDKKKHARDLRSNLYINRVFNEDGTIKGVHKRFRKRKDRQDYECFSVQIAVGQGKQKSTEVIIGANFESSYEKLVKKVLELHGINSSLELKQLFRKAKRHYF